MENSKDSSSQKLVHTLSWIVGKTLVLTSKIIILTFKFGLQFIISKLTSEPGRPQLISNDKMPEPGQNDEAINTI